MTVNAETKKSRESGLGDTMRVVFHALILAMIVRIFFYQPFNIPSGSMKGNLLIGDYLFVSKFSYGFSKYSFPFSPNLFDGRIWSATPKRGDVAVFKLPRDNSTDYIKRVIGLPGDEIQMRNGVLYINGEAVPKKRVSDFVEDGHTAGQTIPRFEETLPNGVKYTVLDRDPNGSFDNTNVYKVPEGHYFMMGDNRDNSTDSRYQLGVGFVPLENFVGRAEVVFFSGKEQLSFYDPLGWPSSIRWSRFFRLVR